MYKVVYIALFKQITDTLSVLEKERMNAIQSVYTIKRECDKLKLAQKTVEEYIIRCEEDISENEN